MRSARRPALALAAAATLALLALPMVVGAAAVPVLLGTTDSFVVLAGAGVTNTGPTTLNGDIGTFPTTAISGTASLTVNGVDHGGDAVTQQAKKDLVTAYNATAGQGPPNSITTDLGGQTLTSGVYNSATTIGLTGELTLDAAGNPNAVFVFQAGSTLTTASASSVKLVNGTQACNVYWQIGSSATLGTGSAFRGTILALESITLTTGTTIEGRALARNGAVTLDTNTITRPGCVRPAGGGTTTTPAGGTTTTPGGGTTTTPGGGTTTPPGSTPTAAQKKAAARRRATARKRAAARAVAAKRLAARKKRAGNARPARGSVGFTG